jgi:hypothetical protein
VRVLGCLRVVRSSRVVLGITRSGLGWPTRSRALAFTALTAEKVFFLARFFGISDRPTGSERAGIQDLYV